MRLQRYWVRTHDTPVTWPLGYRSHSAHRIREPRRIQRASAHPHSGFQDNGQGLEPATGQRRLHVRENVHLATRAIGGTGSSDDNGVSIPPYTTCGIRTPLQRRLEHRHRLFIIKNAK
ncbi:hypothetical protein TNCV_3842091 [Trichonephila clavipes]|nr:hypothetical protein TNCV_3842091 [Trichonephila clavipes]